MADSRLAGITLKLTDEQKRLLRQISDEDFSEIVVGIGTEAQSIPNEYGQNEGDRRFLSVLYETNVDLVQRVEENPTVKESMKELAEVGGYITGPTLLSFGGSLTPQLRLQPSLASGLSFQGLLASAAAW